MSCIQEQPTEGVRPNARENGEIRQSNTARTVGNVGSHPPSRIWASSQFRRRATIHVSSGFIWGILVKETPCLIVSSILCR